MPVLHARRCHRCRRSPLAAALCQTLLWHARSPLSTCASQCMQEEIGTRRIMQVHADMECCRNRLRRVQRAAHRGEAFAEVHAFLSPVPQLEAIVAVLPTNHSHHARGAAPPTAAQAACECRCAGRLCGMAPGLASLLAAPCHGGRRIFLMPAIPFQPPSYTPAMPQRQYWWSCSAPP